MTIELSKEVIQLLRDDTTIKAIATTDDKGVPHVVIKQSLHVNDEGELVYLELLESSQTNKNLVRSIWFNQKVAINLKGSEGISYQIKGSPIKAIISGPIFKKYYDEVREKLGDVDLATVWIIKPEELYNQSYQVRIRDEESQHPYFIHLDRLAK